MKKIVIISNGGEPLYVVETNDETFVLPQIETGAMVDVTNRPDLDTANKISEGFNISLKKDTKGKVIEVNFDPKDIT